MEDNDKKRDYIFLMKVNFVRNYLINFHLFITYMQTIYLCNKKKNPWENFIHLTL